jgi:Tfp pilus assembly protein PilN
MIEKLNLSSYPFRNRTLPWILSALLLGFSLIGLLYLLTDWRDAKAKDDIVKNEISSMETEVQELKAKGDKVQQQLTPEQKRLLVAAHQLVDKKNFRWSYLFADLERVLPSNVSVSRVNVENVYKGTADIDFAVLSRDYQSVINMIDNMNGSGVFQAELRGQDLQKSDTITYSEYSIRLTYKSPVGFSNNQTDGNTVASTTTEEKR